ncbi:DUF6380 family protein [Streptomyces griseoviridis]|nr:MULTISPECIES: DUF6380 family protein [Streptomyces]MDH6696630.1 hypothetical protein [Streptomyces sp. MAA16]
MRHPHDDTRPGARRRATPRPRTASLTATAGPAAFPNGGRAGEDAR